MEPTVSSVCVQPPSRVRQRPLGVHLTWPLFGFCVISTNLVHFTCVFFFSFYEEIVFTKEPVDILMLSALRFPSITW